MHDTLFEAFNSIRCFKGRVIMHFSKTFFFLTFAVLNSLIYADQLDKQDEIIWAPTKLAPTLLTNTIEFNYCNQSTSRFLGCFAAIERFYKFSHPEKSLDIKNNEIILKDDQKFINRDRQFKEYIIDKRIRFTAIAAKKNDLTLKNLITFFNNDFKKLQNVPPYMTALAVNEFNTIAYDPFKVYAPKLKYNGFNRISLPPSSGIELIIDENQIIVDKVLVESPAYLAGFKRNDIITEINGEKIKSPTFETLDQKMRFHINQVVPFKVLRKNKTFDLKVKFGYQKYPPVVDKKFILNGTKYSYLHLKEIPSDFEPEFTCRVFKKILSNMNESSDALILDLRDNPGGYSETAACISSLFLGKNKNLFTEYDFMNNSVDKRESDLDAAFSKPIITLINERTASSGEILAGVLRFHGRSALVGNRSFGKGIGQITETFKTPYGGLDKIELHYTALVMRYPDGTSHQNFGLKPDYQVFLDGDFPSFSEKNSLRMEDLAVFPLTLNPVKAEQKSFPVSIMPKNCYDSKKINENFKNTPNRSFLNDRQLQVAINILECELKI